VYFRLDLRTKSISFNSHTNLTPACYPIAGLFFNATDTTLKALFECLGMIQPPIITPPILK